MKVLKEIEFIKNKPARNRLGLPPMDTLMSEDGFSNLFHIQHYGARSYGGLGTIIVESTSVSPGGRIHINDLGIWKDEHIPGLSDIAKVIKMGGALAGIQINHAGSKAKPNGFERVGVTNEYNYIDQENMRLLTVDEFKDIENQFVDAAKRAEKAGFDFIELHGAHGYLLNQIMHKDMNEVIKSNDILIRAKIVINIVNRIHDEVKIPIGIRFSISDSIKGGMEPEDYKPLIKAIEDKIVYINVSSGATIGRVSNMDEVNYFGGVKVFKALLAKKVKEFTNKPIFVAGNIQTKEDIEFALNNEVDVALLGRESLLNPNKTIAELIPHDEFDDSKYSWNNSPWHKHGKYLKEKDYWEKNHN